MTDGPNEAVAGGPAPAPVPGPAPAPVFGWYIPAGPASAGHPPLGYPAGPGPGAAPGHPPMPVPGAGPYSPMSEWGPVRRPSFAKIPHAQPQPYLRLMRTVNYRWWRPVLGILAFAAAYVVAVFIVALAFVAGGLHLGDLDRLDDLTDPAVLALANATLIVAIPVVWLAWTVHTERFGWASSVVGRIRWRLLWRYGALAVVVVGLGMLLSLVVGGGIGPTSGFDAREFGFLLLVVVLSTPLQSAAEEYVFRGYASQAIASWIPSRAVGAVLAGLITATLFSLIHAPGDVFTFLDRLAFGLAASAVVWLTGGLEAAIGFHAVNNMVIFLVVGALGGATSTDIQADSGTAALIVGVDILVMGIYVWAVAKTRKRWHPEVLSRSSQGAEPSRAGPGWPPPGTIG